MPAPASVPVDPLVQMKSIIAAETEKHLNSVKVLLAKQGQNKEDSYNGSHQNGQAQNGSLNNW